MRNVPKIKGILTSILFESLISVTLDLETGGLVLVKPDIRVEMFTSFDDSAAGNGDKIIVDDRHFRWHINKHCESGSFCSNGGCGKQERCDGDNWHSGWLGDWLGFLWCVDGVIDDGTATSVRFVIGEKHCHG
jgi:hypothetical protein